jgi:hypothetical protein
VTQSFASVAIYIEKNRASSLTFFGFQVVVGVGFAERTVFRHCLRERIKELV